MTVAAYGSYRDSGVEWLGQLPVAWRIKRFRFVFRESGEKIGDEVIGPMLSVSGYRGIEIKEYDDENRRRLDEDLVGYRIVRPGQLVVNTMWLNYAGLGVSDHEGHVSPAYRSYWLDAAINGRFAHRLLRSSIYVQGYTRLLTGIRPNSLQMSRGDLMDFPVILPPPEDQLAIAAFLDRETAKIDALVGEQQRLIKLLKEKRQTVISHAVISGLDPLAQMKRSGVEWLGEVPAGWTVAPIKRFLALVTSGPRGWSELVDGEGAIFFQSQNIGRSMGPVFIDATRVRPPEDMESDRAKLQDDDVVVCITGGRTGAVAHVGVLPEAAYINQHVCILRPVADRILGRYLAYALVSDASVSQLEVASYGLKQGLALDDLRSLVVAVPNITTQRAVVARLDAEVAKFATLIDASEAAIELLQERRAALISATVTGRIDVREAASKTEAA